jgi:hypothetical protein
VKTAVNIKQKLSTLAMIAVAFGFSVQPAVAASATGTLAVTATTAAVVTFTFVSDGSGITLGGTGTSAATVAFGSVQAFGGSVPTGVTKAVNGTTNWSLSTPIDVVVQVANQASNDYTLMASLQTLDAVNTWTLGATNLTATPGALTALGTYGTTAYTLKLTIPFSATPGAISNTINFTATAN